MDGLVRAGAADSLAKILGAAREDLGATEGLAAVAVHNLWDTASDETRRLAQPRFPAAVKRSRATTDNTPQGLPSRGLLLGLLIASAVWTLTRYVRVRREVRVTSPRS